MSRTTTAAYKTATALLEGRIRVVKYNTRGLALECRSAHRATSYIAAVYTDEIGVRRSCTCPNGRIHPLTPRCWHVQAANLLAGLEEGSRR